MKNMTANILLSRAAQYIERHGQATDQYWDPIESGKKPPMCAMGALVACKYGVKTVVSDTWSESIFKNAIIKSCFRKIGKVLNCLPGKFNEDSLQGYNDVSTKEEVIATLRAAIKVK